MGIRALFLLLATFCLSTAIACADDAPVLPGSELIVQDAVAKSDLVVEAKLTNLGEQDMSTDHSSVGPEYHGAQIGDAHFYKGQSSDPMSFAIFPNSFHHEVLPVVGQTYVLFAKGSPTSGEYFIIKILPATKENLQGTILAVLKERAQKKLQEFKQQNP